MIGAAISIGYFEVTAQIIPVLLLTLIVDVGLAPRREDRADPLRLVMLLIVMVIATVGEIAALDAVASQNPTRTAGSFVAISIGSFLAFITVRVGFEMLDTPNAPSTKTLRTSALLIGITASVVQFAVPAAFLIAT